MEEKIIELAEEVFCLSYELKTLSNVILKKEAERWVPGYLYPWTEKSHLDRYNLAKGFCQNKDVIDIACGTGRGSYILAHDGEAKSVSAFDLDIDALRYAKWRNYHPNIQFEKSNAEKMKFNEKFDIAVSFETVEHLINYELFISNLFSALRKDGLLIISTPISSLETDVKPNNPYHVQEWGFLSFQELIKKYFTIESVYVQLYSQNIATHNQERVKNSLYSKYKNKIYRKFYSGKNNDKEMVRGIIKSNDSNIEKYVGQYSLEELKIPNIGYQVVIAKKA